MRQTYLPGRPSVGQRFRARAPATDAHVAAAARWGRLPGTAPAVATPPGQPDAWYVIVDIRRPCSTTHAAPPSQPDAWYVIVDTRRPRAPTRAPAKGDGSGRR